MYININLCKNFVTAYNRMQEKYGTDIAEINGFDDPQLSYTDFILNCKKRRCHPDNAFYILI